MVAVRTLTRAAVVVLMVAAPTIWYACSESAPDSPAGPSVAPSVLPRGNVMDLRGALAVLRRHSPRLLETPGIVGTAVTKLPDGRAGVLILAERAGIARLPDSLDGVPVTVRVTGRIMAFTDPTQRMRPAHPGFSVGHPLITAGTIGARVRDALGRVYILSNNHVLANSNNASIADPEYQPGPYDGGTSADQIATLTDFQTISFASNGSNTIDAAIALSSTDLLDNAVPSDEGYGMPNSTIFGDADGDGYFDNRDALLGLNVQKYGRTTHLTHGQITGVNATVIVCYQVSGFDCAKSARYVDQVIISPGTFSGGGDSGSLIVTDDGNLNPVALLFAGNSSVTIANRIDLVLNRFGVTIDGFAPPPPGPLTDLAVTSVSGPSTIVNVAANVTVTVKNFGNQDVSSFDVSLEDTTDHVTVGTQTVAGLTAGTATNMSFAWTPRSAGNHVLLGRHSLSDDKASNNQRFATVTVMPAVTDIAVSSISPSGPLIQGHVVDVAVTVANIGNQNVASSFDVTLQDSTAGVALGTQTVAGLAVGARTTLTFSWNLTGASLGAHTLLATQSLTDDYSANNQIRTVATVNPKPTDIALPGITGPRSVIQSDTAHVVVTVQNVGEVDVSASFDVVLTDGWAGPTLGTQTVAGLAIGATTTVDIPWNTAGSAVTGHTLFATQKLADNNSANNSIGIGIDVKPVPSTDLAVTGVSAPVGVGQGSTVAVVVAVQNVGGKNVTANFDLVLTDATAGVTIGTQTVTGGLVVGGSTTRTFNWNTTSAALGSHTLVGTQTLADDSAADNQSSTTARVNPPSIDVAVTGMTAPASVTQGNTPTISVTVQNVGGQDVSSSFNIVLTDATAGVTIGTQAVTGLTLGASATRYFNWNTTGATVGGHNLVATQSLADDSAANNQRSTTVNITPAPADIAVVSITAPSQVTVGDTAPVVVTVQDVGGQDVTNTFDVALTDGTAGNAILGTQTIFGLAAGASSTLTFNWNTAGAGIWGHILTATQQQADANSSNNARATSITVNPPRAHVGNLDGFANSGVPGDTTWSATVRITAHDAKHNPLNGVTVNGTWNGSGPDATCVTSDDGGGGTGTCTVVLSSIPNATQYASFAVSGMSLPGGSYNKWANHDPDGSSNGFSVDVKH